MLLAFATFGFTAPGGRVPQANAVVRPLMMAPADLPDALNLYAATSFAGLMTTAALAPIIYAMPKMNPAVLVADTPLRSRFASAATAGQAMDDDEVCELYASAPSTMHQPLYMDEEEEDWWVCSHQQLQEKCREVMVDGEIQVACAF